MSNLIRASILATILAATGFGCANGGKQAAAPPAKPLTAKLVLTLDGHTDMILGVGFSPKGKWLATSSKDKTARIWDAETGKERFKLEGHRAAVGGLAIRPDGERLATGARDQMIKLWDPTTGKETQTIEAGLEIMYMAYSGDGRFLAAGGMSGTLTMGVGGSGMNHCLKLFDARTGAHVLRIGEPLSVIALAVSPDGKRVAIGEAFAPNVRLYDTASDKRLLEIKDVATALAFSPDNKWLVTAGTYGFVNMWDAETGKNAPVVFIGNHTKTVRGLAFSPDGKWLASAGTDKTVKLWSVTKGDCLLTLTDYAEELECVAFSADGRRLAAGGKDKTVKVWELAE